MLKVHIENAGQVAVLQLRGHIVIGPEVEVLRRSVLSQISISAVVLDLARVSRIDAKGLGVLLELREQLQSAGVEFRLMNVTGSVQQLLSITCLDSVFQISREEEILSREQVLEAALS